MRALHNPTLQLHLVQFWKQALLNGAGGHLCQRRPMRFQIPRPGRFIRRRQCRSNQAVRHERIAGNVQRLKTLPDALPFLEIVRRQIPDVATDDLVRDKNQVELRFCAVIGEFGQFLVGNALSEHELERLLNV